MEQAYGIADIAIRVSVVMFMVANLMAIGLETDVRAALAPLARIRFLLSVLAVDCLLGPALALALVLLLPMERAYAVGLLLISLAPAAPFLPMMVRRAGGDLAHTAAFMLIAAAGTVVLLPLGVPFIVPGVELGAWDVARPLLVLLLLPMTAGMAVRATLPRLAEAALRIVRPVGSAATLSLLLAILFRHAPGFWGAVGSYAILAQLVYAIGLVLGGHLLAHGLPPEQRSVVSLGACTRNLGAALAPLLVADPDPKTIVMIALGVPTTLLMTWMASSWLHRQAVHARAVVRHEPEG